MKRLGLIAVAAMLILLTPFALSDSPKPRILLVLDSHYCPFNSTLGVDCTNDEILPYYDRALAGNGFSYDTCSVPSGNW